MSQEGTIVLLREKKLHKKEKVLITGAAGFVGRYASKEFACNGYEVVGLGWGKFPDYKSWGLSAWYEAEVSMESLHEFAGMPDIIVHCAGGSSVGYSVDHPRKDFCLTVDTTSHVLEYIRQHAPECRLVYPSTAAVYGQVKSTPISVNAPLNPISPYGVHKLMAESLCRMYSYDYQLKVSIVRLFSIYGEGLRKQLLWDACQKFSSGLNSFFGTGEEVRDWLHVSDAARLLQIASGYASADCPVVNGGSGKGGSVKDVLRILADSMSVECSPVFTSGKKAGDPEVLVADISEAVAWGWNPKKEYESGISDYATWFLQ